MSDDLTPQRHKVNETWPHAWPSTGCPTDGFMRACLALVGVETRGREMKRADLLRLCRENGLDFADRAVVDDRNATTR
jgi:hypothetical protein